MSKVTRVPALDIHVLDDRKKPILTATVSIRRISPKKGRSQDAPLDKFRKVYRAESLERGTFHVQVDAPGKESQQREVQIEYGTYSVTFVLGAPGTSYYYRGGIKIPLRKQEDLIGIAVRRLDSRQETSLGLMLGDLRLKTPRKGPKKLPDQIFLRRHSKKLATKARYPEMIELQRDDNIRYVGPILELSSEIMSFMTNELICRKKAGASEKAVRAAIASHGLNIVREIGYSRNSLHLRSDDPASYELLDTCEELLKTGLFELVEPNLVVVDADDATPNDFLFTQQPHHPIINVANAWDTTMGHEHTIIAVVDSGCDIDHPDLGVSFDSGTAKIYEPFDFVGMDANPTSGTHGTESSGIASAMADNSEGVAGVAPLCRLMPIRRPSGGSDTDYADMYIWIAGLNPGSATSGFPAQISPGADIITNSFGLSDTAISTVMADAFDEITDNGRQGKGCVVCFSVGNANSDFTTYRMWANYSRTIAVASSAISPPDANEIKVSTSNFGTTVDVCAPGGGPAGGAEARTLSTIDVGSGSVAGNAGAATNDYDDFGQTSCACPQVAATAGLMLSIDPFLAWDETRDILRATADRIDVANTDAVGQWSDLDGDGFDEFSQWYGFGRINTEQAVHEAGRLFAAQHYLLNN